MRRTGRSRWAAAFAAVALVGMASGRGCTGSGTRPGRDTFARVERGTTVEQVSATVGGPPGDYRTDESAALPHGCWRLWRHTAWVSNEAVPFVEFDGREAAVDVRELRTEHYTGPCQWERVRDRLGIVQPPPPAPRPIGAVPPELD